MNLTQQDFLVIRSNAALAHQKSKLALEAGTVDDLEQQRDDCEVNRNAVQTVLNGLEDEIEKYRKEKRALDDKISDIRSVQREFDVLKADLTTDAKRLNNAFWDLKKGRKIFDPGAESTPSVQ